MARLERLTAEQERFTSGRFEFPFGKIEYVDPLTLGIQYREIFVDRLYDFSAETKDPFIIDCGGNIGLSVVRFKIQYPESRVLTYEADPNIYRVLVRNLATLGYSDVQVECAAVWIANGLAQFSVEGGEGGRLSPEGQLAVKTTRLADRIAGKVDLLKLDIEGAEWAVLEDLCSTGSLRHVRKLIVEFHGWVQEARALGRILAALAEFGFFCTFPWSFCEPGLAGPPDPTPFVYAKDAKFILFLHAWQPRHGYSS